MPATKKNKRKIHVNGRDFYWRCENPYNQMTITTPDKGFIAIYKPQIVYHGRSGWMWGLAIPVIEGNGKIEVNKTNIPELSHIKHAVILETPDWSDVDAREWIAPGHVRKIIVHIFETLM